MNFFKRFIFFIIGSLVLSCSVKEQSKPENPFVVGETLITPQELIIEDKIQNSSYQLGDHWNRDPMPVFHNNHNTIFRSIITSSKGRVSSNFILAHKISKTEAYFIGTVHSLKSSCISEGISFYVKDEVLEADCTDIHSIVPETDIVIFSVRFHDEKDLKNLEPVVFGDGKVTQGEKLRFFGIDIDDFIPGYYPLVSDSSGDCRLLSNEESKVFDLDQLNTIEVDSYWSYAVTCDVRHGDSGGMFLNREGELVGVLWTGAFPKKNKYDSQAILSYVSEGNRRISDNIWRDFNYIIPSYRINDHLKNLIISN